MKKLSLILIIVFWAGFTYSQNLLEMYKSGKIQLVVDDEFAQNVNWDIVFESWHDTSVGRWVGDRKSLMVAPDGSVIVSHHFRDFYTVFTPQGDFNKELQVKDHRGRIIRKLPHFHGVLDGNIYYTGLDNMGNLRCFDKDGNLIKTLHLDYGARQIIPLPNRKLGVMGWVLWRESVREFVAIVDYETNEEKIIWDRFKPMAFMPGTPRDMFEYAYEFKERGMVSFSSMPFTGSSSRRHPLTISNIGNKIILTIPETGDIKIFDLKGNLVSEQTIDWAKNYLSVDEQKEIQRRAIERYRNIAEPQFAAWVSAEENRAARDYFVREMEIDLARINKPIPMPVFSAVFQDSDDNLLFFEFPEEEGANKFNVWIYHEGGQFIAQSSLVAEDINLEIKPSKMVFHNGYIYALVVKEGVEGVPLRLMRFKLKN